MPRPVKSRRICHFPQTLEFYPTKENEGTQIVTLTVDEYETIRLIDKEGLSQEECGIQLGVGRTTAQKIYDIARKKIAEALVLGLTLKIEGGDYHLCNGNAGFCYKNDCYKKQIQQEYQLEKGEHIMRIAVTYDNGNIFQHFGRTEYFKIYDIEDNKVRASVVISTNGFGHSALAGILQALEVDALICGGIGGGAQMALAQLGIQLYGGVSGNADAAVNALLEQHLDFNPDVHCNHHDHEHGNGEHTCGSHGCGHCGHH